MKKHAILLASILLIVSATTAVIEGPKSNGTDVSITSGSSASSSTSVGPNGSEWTGTVEMTGRDPNVTGGDRIENISFQEERVSFNGYITAPTPCHIINQEIEETGNNQYRMNIITSAENPSQICTQQLVAINYNGEFQSITPYQLEILHNNQSIETITHPDYGNTSTGPETDPKPEEKSVVSSIMDWFRNLF